MLSELLPIFRGRSKRFAKFRCYLERAVEPCRREPPPWGRERAQPGRPTGAASPMASERRREACRRVVHFPPTDSRGPGAPRAAWRTRPPAQAPTAHSGSATAARTRGRLIAHMGSEQKM